MIPKVSIIVPVYRVEDYVERCVKSLFGQTLDDLEFIFIDDCGGDRSMEIIQRTLEDFPERKSQVKFIYHAENMGVSKARQDGVDIAAGEYIIHCDPDDWIERNMYELLYNNAKNNNADLVICNYRSVTDRGSRIITQQPEKLTSISILQSISGVSRISLHGGLVNKLIRSSYYKDVHFPKDINYCEDVAVMFQILQHNLKISYLNKSLYNYKTDRPGSICKIVDSRTLKMDRRLIDFISTCVGDKPDYRSCKYSFIVSTIFNRAFLYGNLSNKEFMNTYKSFYPYLHYNNQIHRIDIVLLELAMKGHFNLGKKLHFTLLKAKLFVRQWIK